jgi:hypothetical protein
VTATRGLKAGAMPTGGCPLWLTAKLLDTDRQSKK